MDQSKSELEQLKKIIRKKSYREGEFKLVSGQTSNFYCDLKNTTLDQEGAYLVGRCVTDKVKQEGLKIDAVGGMTLGADPIATAVSLMARDKGIQWPAYIVRKEPKAHGTSKYVEGVENLPKGARLLVLEDVVTTGGTSLKAIQYLRDDGYDPVAVITVVDRESGARENFEGAGLKFFALATLKEIQELN